MNCDKCPFSAEVERESAIYICLVNGETDHGSKKCDLPELEDKIKASEDCKIAKSFQKNADIVRAALLLMRDHNMSAYDAVETAKIIHGRY